MKILSPLILAFGTLSISAQAHDGPASRGGGGRGGWTGVIIERTTTTSLICRDPRGNTLRFISKYEVSNAGNATVERHVVYGEDRGSQNVDIRGELSADAIDLKIFLYGTRFEKDTQPIATLRGRVEHAVYEGAIPMSFSQTLAGPLAFACEYSKR